MSGTREKYDHDCENDAAFHLYWRFGTTEELAQHPDDGVIGWAKARFPEQHARLASAFKVAVKEILG